MLFYGDKMKAIVKNIMVKSSITDEDKGDVFEKPMAEFIGKEIDVEPLDGYKNWFMSSSPMHWKYHRSWLLLKEEENKMEISKFEKALKLIDIVFDHEDCELVLFADGSGHVGKHFSDEKLFSFVSLDDFIEETSNRLKNMFK
jgi:hypothetical protein